MITKLTDFKNILNSLDSDVYAIDTETSGLRICEPGFFMCCFTLANEDRSFVFATHECLNRYATPTQFVDDPKFKGVLQPPPDLEFEEYYYTCKEQIVEMDGWVEVFKEWAKDKQFVLHNAKFDWKVLKHLFGIDLNIFWDTQVAARMTNNVEVTFRKSGLKKLHAQYFGGMRAQFQEILKPSNWSIEDWKLAYSIVDIEQFEEYVRRDGVDTWDLYGLTQKWMTEWTRKTSGLEYGIDNAYFNIELPLIKVVGQMELDGISLDEEHRSRIEKEYSERLNVLDKELKSYADINFSSSKQLGAFLYQETYVREETIVDVLEHVGLNLVPPSKMYNKHGELAILKGGLRQLIEAYPEHEEVLNSILIGSDSIFPLPIKEYKESKKTLLLGYLFSDKVTTTQKYIQTEECRGLNLPVLSKEDGGLTDKGSPSTSATTMEKLAELHDVPFITDYLEYTKLGTLLSTFIIAMEKEVYPDGKIRCNFNSIGTDTSRFSSSKPNLQNQPKGDKNIRDMFKADDGDVLIAFDYSQMEYRGAGHIFDCKEMIYEYNHGSADFHNKTSEMVGCSRDYAKRVNFGVLYGIGAKKLCGGLGISPEEAQDLIDKFFESYPELYEGIKSCFEYAIHYGYIPLEFGHIRRFDIPREITIDNYEKLRYMQQFASILGSIERRGLNTLVQGSTAEVVKLAMIEVRKYFDSLPLDCRAKILVQVHDEIVISCNEKYSHKIEPRVREIMQNIVNWSVVMVVDKGEIGKSWGNLKPIKSKVEYSIL